MANVNAIKSDIRKAIINQKANACPMVARLAWHGAGTFDKSDGTGGLDGSTMRFEPEASDDANAGLGIIRDMLTPVVTAHPNVSIADIWGLAGVSAIEFLGGPKVPFNLGRTDKPDGSHCPAIGRLPDASQGAQHLRDVFYRMGFDDGEIVALSGAHTLGRCHPSRSGFDGPWTRNPLKFDNAYFKLLLSLDWVPRKWDGPVQYEDTATGKLMMLPTDICLTTDGKFRPFVELYAENQGKFFTDFAAAFAKLLANGAPATCDPDYDEEKELSEQEKLNAEFLELSMHGSLHLAKAMASKVDVNAREPTSARTALHKAAFWGHTEFVTFLLKECKVAPNALDYQGDTPLHDAVRFGHTDAVRVLLASGADASVVNKLGHNVQATALQYGKTQLAQLVGGTRARM